MSEKSMEKLISNLKVVKSNYIHEDDDYYLDRYLISEDDDEYDDDNTESIDSIYSTSKKLKSAFMSGKLNTLIVSGEETIGTSNVFYLGFKIGKPDVLVDLVNFMSGILKNFYIDKCVEYPDECPDSFSLKFLSIESFITDEYGEIVRATICIEEDNPMEIDLRKLDSGNLSIIKEELGYWKSVFDKGNIRTLEKKIENTINWCCDNSPEPLCYIEYWLGNEDVDIAGEPGRKYYAGWCDGIKCHEIICGHDQKYFESMLTDSEGKPKPREFAMVVLEI